MDLTVTFRLANFTWLSLNRLIRRLDIHLVLVGLLILPALTPLLQPTLTRSADGVLHMYRVVVLDHMLRQGVLFPRWWPDLAYGYGLPLFVFYAPLAYYLTLAWRLAGMDIVSAVNASFALALLLSGIGAYLMVKELFGSRAGVLAGMAYAYAPYQLYNVLFRGSLPIAWAGACLPFAMWALGRLLREGRPRNFLLSAGTCAAALLAHNISALLFFPLLILYGGTMLMVGRPAGEKLDYGRLSRAAGALGLGLALSAFFLVPALLEKGFIQVQRVVTPPDFDYHYNFVELAELLALPQPADTGLLNPAVPFTLGPVQVVLAALGLLGLGWSGPGQRRAVLFAAASLAGAIFLILPVSVSLWDRLPLIAFVQQPHRLLSLAAFLLALLAGAGVAALTRPSWLSGGLTGLGVLLIFISAVPLLYPRYYAPLPADPSLTGMMAYERARGAIGTTSFGEYLPAWVEQIPRESPLEVMYRAGTTVERLDPSYLPAGATLVSAAYSFNRAELVVDSPEPYQAIFHLFYFPGWEARLDGQVIPITPWSERGLVSVVMPAGQHQLLLRFTDTPVRLAANAVSGLALLTGLLVLVRGWPNRRLAPTTAAVPGRSVALLAALALGLIAVKMLFLDYYDTPLKRVFDGSHVAEAAAPTRVNFGQQINLLGYNLDPVRASAGQDFNLTFYWQARQPLSADYSALAHLIDPQGHLYAGQDNLHPGHLPATWWEPWGFVRDRHRVTIPAGTPPGEYLLAAGLYDPLTWARLPVLDGGDAGRLDIFAIPVQVLKPSRPPELEVLEIAWPAAERPAPGLELLGTSPERDRIRRNDFLRVALFWEALVAPLPDYQVSLRLAPPDGAAPLVVTGRPSFGRYPTPLWAAGERVRDNHAFWIPPDSPAGTYGLQLQLIDETGQPTGGWLALGELNTEE